MGKFSKIAGGLAALLTIYSNTSLANLPEDLPDFDRLKPIEEEYIGNNLQEGFIFPEGERPKVGKILHQIYSAPEMEVGYVILSIPCFNGSGIENYKMAIRDQVKRRFFYRNDIFKEFEEIPWESKPDTDFKCPKMI